jgi:hypothetical protein
MQPQPAGQDGPAADRNLLRRTVQVGIGFVVVAELISEVLYRWHRARRSTASWWERVGQRDRQRLHVTEVFALARRLPRR